MRISYWSPDVCSSDLNDLVIGVLRLFAESGRTDDADLELQAVEAGAGIRGQADPNVQPTGKGAVVFHQHPRIRIGGWERTRVVEGKGGWGDRKTGEGRLINKTRKETQQNTKT